MRYQSNRSGCGPAALGNALSALGIRRGEDELIALCKQTPEGTSPENLVRAINQIQGVGATKLTFRGKHASGHATWALNVLTAWVATRGIPVILCVDRWEHWVACTGRLGPRFCIIDSADNALVLYLTDVELLTRWEGPDGSFHGIGVVPDAK